MTPHHPVTPAALTLWLCTHASCGSSTPWRPLPSHPILITPCTSPFALQITCFSPNLLCFHVSFLSALCLPSSFPLLNMANPTHPARSSSKASFPVFLRRSRCDFLGPFVALCTRLSLQGASHVRVNVFLCQSPRQTMGASRAGPLSFSFWYKMMVK